MTSLVLLSVLVLFFWLLVAADAGRWFRAGHRLELDADAPRVVPPDTLVAVPACNEEEMILECLPSLIKQSDDFAQLVYVNDRSRDRTGEIAAELSERSSQAQSIDVIDGAPPPAGWSGKLHALNRGLDFALSGRGESKIRWILFTDADIRHPPGSLRALRAKAREGDYDVVSVMVRLRSRSFWERLLIPPFVYFFQLLYPFRRVSDPGSRCAAAAGGCVLISRAHLERMGGLEAIRGAVIDDVALARTAKDHGGRLWLGLCPGMESRRRYDRLGEIVQMVARTAFTQLNYSYVLLILCILALALFLVSPPFLCIALAWQGKPLAASPAATAWLVQAVTIYPVLKFEGVSPLYAFTLPVASIFYMGMTALSAWNHWRGKGPKWRGM